MERKFERVGERYSRSFIVIAVVSVLVVAGFWLTLRQKPNSRIGVALATNPVVVWSWDKTSGSFVLVALPAETRIEAVFGYGKYNLESLWKLGRLDNLAGLLLAYSLEDALSIPVKWYAGPANDELVRGDQPLLAARTIFSPSSLLKFVSQKYQTNLPPLELISLIKATTSVRPDKITVINLTGTPALTPEQLPDGTASLTLNINYLDSLFANKLEVALVRNEALKIAVYNTTKVAGLGQKVAALLSRAGANVIAVDNKPNFVSDCQIWLGKEFEDSDTVNFIKRQYDCSVSVKDNSDTSLWDDRADVTLFLGESYASRYLPRRR